MVQIDVLDKLLNADDLAEDKHARGYGSNVTSMCQYDLIISTKMTEEV